MTGPSTPVIVGDWNLTIATPIGKLAVSLTVRETPDGLVGTAHGKGEDVPLRDIVATSDPGPERVTWTQAITKPLRLNLAFDVVAAGDTLTGVSRAGRLPASQVSGQRAPAAQPPQSR